jgi:hypothetical protein
MQNYDATHITKAAQAHAQTQAWQRVCLSNRTTKTTDKPVDEEEHRNGNSDFTKKRVQYYYDSLVQSSSSVYQMNFCAENPPHRKAENRCTGGM